MPRKKSPRGRARVPTPADKLLRSIEKTNRKLNRLDSAGLYGKYATKKLLRTIRNESPIKYNRGKRVKVTVNLKKLNPSQIRYYQKVFNSFLESKTSSPIGIKDVESKTRDKLKQSLSEITDEDITEQDVEDFYTLVEDNDFRYLADKIGDSDIYILVNESKSRDLNEEGFTKMLEQYMTVNTKEARDAASNLYNKFVIGE